MSRRDFSQDSSSTRSGLYFAVNTHSDSYATTEDHSELEDSEPYKTVDQDISEAKTMNDELSYSLRNRNVSHTNFGTAHPNLMAPTFTSQAFLPFFGTTSTLG